jgi:hypothetical protein
MVKEMVEACGSHGREMKRIEGFGEEIRGNEFTQEALVVDGWTALKWILNN